MTVRESEATTWPTKSSQHTIAALRYRLIDPAAFGEPVTHAMWHTTPSWCLVPEQDRAIGSDAELAMAARAHCHTEQIPGSHLVMVAHPEAAVRLIETAARAAG
jgi:pimeloyl-ACP methyl ester carboxylesterase